MIDSIEHSKTHSNYKYNKYIKQYITTNIHLKELSTVNNTDIESLCSHPIDEVHSLVQNHTHCTAVPHYAGIHIHTIENI